MRRFFIAFIVTVFTFAGVYAEDRINLEGDLSVKCWDTQNFDSSEGSWWSQRLRLGGNIDISNNVSAHFRMDLGEGIWGLDYKPGAIARPGYGDHEICGDSKLHIDQAYFQINNGNWALKAGQQYVALGIAQVFDANTTSLVFALDYDPITVALVYAKLDERGCVCDNDYFDDLDAYAINVAYKGDNFNSNVFYTQANDGTDFNFSPWAIGFNGSTKVGIVDIIGELAFLGGDMIDPNNKTKVDFTGTQLYIAAKAPITDKVKIGAELMYASGAGDDERQLTNLADWDKFSPMSNNTPANAEFSALPSKDAFDPFGVNGGVIAGTVFADFEINDLLSAGCKIGYFEPEDSSKLEGADLLAYNMWIKYQLAKNTYLSGTYMSSSASCDYDLYSEDMNVFVGEIVVKF